MNRIHRKVEYALIALKHMRARAPGERTTVKEMAGQYGCPHDVLARVLQTLANRSVLTSEQGVRGGYSIAKDLNHVSFYDLLEMILGPIGVARCLHEAAGKTSSIKDEAPCELRGTCNIVSPIQLLNRKMSDFYRSVTVGELIDAGKKPKAPLVEAPTSEGSQIAGRT